MPSSAYAIGIDVGGTKIAAGIVDLAGRVLATHRTRAHSERCPEHVIAAIEEACRALLARDLAPREEILGAGIGFAGTVDGPAGTILISSNLPDWAHVPLREILAERLGLPVVLDNDAHMCAVGEHRFGAGRGTRDMCYVCFSTGYGLGAIVNNRLCVGHTGSAGELSHVVVEVGGPQCTCGKRGCLMTYASGIGIARMVRERVAAGEPTALGEMLPCDGRRISGEQVAAAAAAGDRLAREVLQTAGYYFGVGLSMLVQLFNPELIVVGGGLTRVGSLLMDACMAGMHENTQPELWNSVRFAPWALGDNVGVIGAAAEVFAGQIPVPGAAPTDENIPPRSGRSPDRARPGMEGGGSVADCIVSVSNDGHSPHPLPRSGRSPDRARPGMARGGSVADCIVSVSNDGHSRQKGLFSGQRNTHLMTRVTRDRYR